MHVWMHVSVIMSTLYATLFFSNYLLVYYPLRAWMLVFILVCMHGYPPIQYLLYTTPMHACIYHVPYTMYHLFSCHLPFLTYLYCTLLLCTPNAPRLYLSHPMYASPNCASIRSWVLPIPLSCLESNRHGMVQCGMVLHGITWCGVVWCVMVWYGMHLFSPSPHCASTNRVSDRCIPPSFPPSFWTVHPCPSNTPSFLFIMYMYVCICMYPLSESLFSLFLFLSCLESIPPPCPCLYMHACMDE
jgi:hypothetical protein